MKHKRFIVLLGVVLGSYVPAAAQSPAPPVLLAQERVEPIMTLLRTVPAPLPATFFRRPLGTEESPVHFRPLFAAAYERGLSPEHLLPIERVSTFFLTESSLPLVQIWGRRLQLDAFQSKLHLQNVQLGPSGSGGLQDFRFPRQIYPGTPRSFSLFGISLRFRLGRHAETERSIHVWRRMAGIAGSGHGCGR